MPVNLSIKRVPDALAQALEDRAVRNKRSLQRELMGLLEEAVSTVDEILKAHVLLPIERHPFAADATFDAKLDRAAQRHLSGDSTA